MKTPLQLVYLFLIISCLNASTNFDLDQSYHDPPEFAWAEIIDQCENLLSDSNGSPELYQQTSRYLNLVSKYFKNKIDAIEFMENETIE